MGILKKDPEQLKKQIENLEMMSKSFMLFFFTAVKSSFISITHELATSLLFIAFAICYASRKIMYLL